MIVTNFVYDDLASEVATASALFGGGAGVNVHLAKVAFTPAVGLTVASFTEADFPGYTLLTSGGLAQQQFRDPVDGQRVVQLKEPAGGWHWQTSGAPVPPQTIFGFYVTDSLNAQLLGCALLDAPVMLTGAPQNVDVPWIRMKLSDMCID